MAHIWFQRDSGDWERVTPAPGEGRVSLPDRRGGSHASWPMVLRAARSGGEQWMLLSCDGAPVQVNGRPLMAGVRILRDRDEIRLAGESPLYFSTERLPVVESFPGAEQAVPCARCRQEIKVGTPAVRCPGSSCGLWFHQSREIPCWTGYAGEPFRSCAMCDYPAALAPDADFRWTPEDL